MAKSQNAAHWRKKLKNQGSLSAGPSDWRGALSQKAASLGALVGLDERSTYNKARGALDLADWIPGVGDVATAGDARDEFKKGNFKTSAALSGAAVIGMVPGAGDLVSQGIKKAVKKGAAKAAETKAGKAAAKAAAPVRKVINGALSQKPIQAPKPTPKPTPKRRPATREDFEPGNVGGLMDRDDWTILTAQNPMGKQGSKKANAAANAKLKEALTAEGYDFIDGGVGKYGNSEDVLAVLGIPEDRARHFGNMFKQDSILTNKGLIYHDGRITPGKSINTFDEEPEDFFTSMPNGSRFAMDLDWDNEIPAPLAAQVASPPPAAMPGALSQARLNGADFDNMLSTRRPSAPNYGTQGNPDQDMLIQDGNAMRQAPKAFEANMGMLAEEPFMQGFKGSADEIYDQALRRGADNLKYIVNDLMDPELVAKSRPWYETANKMSRDAAQRAGIPDEAAYGVAAVTSPQKPWDINVANMERLVEMHGDRFTNSPKEIDDVMRWVRERNEGKSPGAVASLGEDWARRVMEMPYEELEDQFDRYGRVVLTDRARYDEMVPRIMPDGAREGDYGKITWGSGSEIGKALNILDNPDIGNIRAQMEGGGKVPSFYNNIAAPNSQLPIVTADTHSAGALSLFPGGGKDPIVYRTMGLSGTPKAPGAKDSAVTGSKGLYGMAVDMHALAGQELGMLPREVQSATWEGVRRLWGQNAKTPALKRAVSDAWMGSPDPDAARAAIRQLLGR